MRKITVTITDTDSEVSVSGESYLEMINSLYEIHGINSTSEIIIAVNEELNRKLNQNFRLSIPSLISTLPEGKNW